MKRSHVYLLIKRPVPAFSINPSMRPYEDVCRKWEPDMVPEIVGKSAYSLSLVNQAKFLETPRPWRGSGAIRANGMRVASCTNELPVRTRSAARRPSSSLIGVADQGGGIPSDRACEVDPVPSRMLLFCHAPRRDRPSSEMNQRVGATANGEQNETRLAVVGDKLLQVSLTAGFVGSVSLNSIGAWPKMPMTAGSLPSFLTPS